MELNEYQKRAKATAVFPTENALQYLGLQVASEAGEIAGKIAKYFRGDYSTGGQFQYQEWRELVIKEMGDELWYLAVLADFLETSLEEIALKNLEKLKDRKDRGVLKGSGDNR